MKSLCHWSDTNTSIAGMDYKKQADDESPHGQADCTLQP